MNQSFFKEILEQEIHSVFLTPADSANPSRWRAKTLDAVVDRPEMAWPEADDRPASPTSSSCWPWPVRLPR